jgi:hypothetical protein
LLIGNASRPGQEQGKVFLWGLGKRARYSAGWVDRLRIPSPPGLQKNLMGFAKGSTILRPSPLSPRRLSTSFSPHAGLADMQIELGIVADIAGLRRDRDSQR